MLTEDQINLIRSSAGELAMLDIPATTTFYENLFDKVPGVRGLFPADMFAQSEKLWKSVVAVVGSLENLDQITASLKEMGARHVEYGALPEHYPVVSEVLVQTIASLMKDDWTAEHQEAWASAMRIICDVMLEGASEASS